jgi:hypothetical protein
MASDTGFPSKERESTRVIQQEHVTAQPVRKKQIAKDVIAHSAVFDVLLAEAQPDDIVEAGSSTTNIVATAHLAQVGDIIRFTSGALNRLEAKVLKTDANNIELAEILEQAPAPADTFTILRHVYQKVNEDGTISVSAAPTALRYNLDGALTEVTEDTVTPANNRPLPVKLTSLTGDINITANDLNVQLIHTGANPDSVRIGDGTELLEISASGEAQVRDDDANTTLTAIEVDTSSIDTKLTSTNALLATIDADTSQIAADTTSLDGKTVVVDTGNVTVAASALPTGAATSALQTTGNSTLSDILTELGLKADLTETQPVSVASLPLPSGAATELTLASLLTELQAKADLAETQPVSLASQPLPTGAATEVTSAALLTELQAKADLTETQPVSLASQPLPTGAATEVTLASVDTKLTDNATATNQATANASLSNIEADLDALNARLAGNLVPETFDYLALTYVAAGNGQGEIETVTYRTGGAAGSVVATLTLAYDGSDNLASVTRT